MSYAAVRLLLVPVLVWCAALIGPAEAEPALAHHHMIAAANPHAAEAGLAMLRRGGSAVDAAIAAQAVLGLVEPQSSGIGGGAFLLHYDAKSHAVESYDGRETAPAAATPELFLDASGKPLGFLQAVVGGRSVGVPGVLRMLELAHKAHGKLPWADLFQPAIDLAEHGFVISPRLHYLIATDTALAGTAAAKAYFFTAASEPKPAGGLLRNPDYADTLRRIAKAGAGAFYGGAIAADIVAAVRAAANPGGLTLADLAAYRAKERGSLCRPYRRWQVCGMPPPSSGGIAELQILGLLEHFDLDRLSPTSAAAVHLVGEASKLAFADRDTYVADTDFLGVPVAGLLDRDYLAARARLIDPKTSIGHAKAGEPPRRAGFYAPQLSDEIPSTSHLSIVDDDGNAVAMTTTVEGPFGSRLFVRGFILNNQLTDFSFVPSIDGVPVANRVEPGKRPRSSMSPTLVLDDKGNFLLAIGSPGGSRIIGFVTEALLGVLDWRLDPQAAVELPHYLNRNGPTELEAETPLETLQGALEALGEDIRLARMNSGLHAILRTPQGLQGGADPRREGVALGD